MDVRRDDGHSVEKKRPMKFTMVQNTSTIMDGRHFERFRRVERRQASKRARPALTSATTEPFADTYTIVAVCEQFIRLSYA